MNALAGQGACIYFSTWKNQQNSRILTTERTEFTEGKSEKARKTCFLQGTKGSSTL
jgi:hypothetical protein